LAEKLNAGPSSLAGPSAHSICSSTPAYSRAQCEFIGCCTWTDGKCEGDEHELCPTFQIFETLVSGEGICDRNWKQEDCLSFGCCSFINGLCASAVGAFSCLDGPLLRDLLPVRDAECGQQNATPSSLHALEMEFFQILNCSTANPMINNSNSTPGEVRFAPCKPGNENPPFSSTTPPPSPPPPCASHNPPTSSPPPSPPSTTPCASPSAILDVIFENISLNLGAGSETPCPKLKVDAKPAEKPAEKLKPGEVRFAPCKPANKNLPFSGRGTR